MVIDTAFCEVVAHLPVQVDQPRFELPGIEPRGEFVAQQGFSCEGSLDIAAMHVAVDRDL